MCPNTQDIVDDNVKPASEFGQTSARDSRPDDLPVAERLDENLDDATPDDTILARPEWGSVAMAAMAGSFDMVVPAAMLAANYSLFRNADLRGDGSLTDGSGTLEAAFRNKFEGFDDEGKPKRDEDSLLDHYADMVADERAEQKREMEEWSRSEHEMAGVKMTGEQWGQLADDIKPGSKGYDWLIEYLMRKGQTREEAAQYAKDLNLAADGMKTSHPTEAQKDAQARINANPESQGILKDVRAAESRDFPPVSETTTSLTNTSQQPSVTARTGSLYEDFPSAPDLTEHHAAALAATEPLDVKAVSPKLAAAAPAPQPGGAGGLDI